MGNRAVDALLGFMDAVARVRSCERLQLSVEGTRGDQTQRIETAVRGKVDRVLDILDRDDLIAMMRSWWIWNDDRRAHVVGLRGADLAQLRAGARVLLMDGWIPPRAGQKKVPGTNLSLCWYGAGARHAGEFDDDDGTADSANDEFLAEAVYTIIHANRLDGHEQSGITFEEGRAWVAGARFFETAQKEGRRLALVFADAAATSCGRNQGSCRVNRYAASRSVFATA